MTDDMGTTDKSAAGAEAGLEAGDMAGQVVLVSGATSGIGKVTARVLAERGARVVFTARDRAKAEAVREEIRAAAGHDGVEALHCDFMVQAQVRAAAAAFRERYERLDVLVNNAGAFFLAREETADGIERTLAVNHLAAFLLTNLLLDTLRASAPARVVTVSSDAHERARMHFEDLGLQRGYGGFRAYAQSKLANLLFTVELARRLEGSGVTANALHPGFVATDITTKGVPVIGRLLRAFFGLWARDVESGAQTSIYLATAPELETVSGRYFVDRRAVPPAPAATDAEAARRLWRISEELTGLAAA